MAFDDYGEAIGTFSVDEYAGYSMSCPYGRNNAVTHIMNDDKSFVQLNWMAPPYFTGPVHFRATFVKDVANYWVKVNSSVVNVVPFVMPSSGVNFASTSPLMALPLLALIVGMF
ncbi:hypothetical protein DAPPUDRAFT_312997 [Daphnia pulex]|uniref:Reelin domain-containing protein n=1 Tax=Daphnia pulex TaxID=6669 RepID=E9G182_DAPPU|nr:hypothetical protein DAPPUDRAFT_312997 [Daphnia pulex]|eukprot:EFX86626.1 hypothetical protein DAPPUDRAFT_312997 [Daphnia pulex]